VRIFILTVTCLLFNFCSSRVYDESFQWSVNDVLFKCVVENDLTGVKTYVEAGEDVNAVKEEVTLTPFITSDMQGLDSLISAILDDLYRE